MHLIIFSHWFFHPLHGLGYQFWSGIAGSFLTSLPGWFIAAMIFVRHQNCHVRRCPWRGSYTVDGTPYRVCKKHHPNVPDKVTVETIQKAHEDAIK